LKTSRTVIAFFDYLDVYEDFYPHYGVSQQHFATQWADTGNHAWLSLIQREIGDVSWYVFSLAPELTEAHHEEVGCKVKFFRSSLLHRCLWRFFYLSRISWRWKDSYRAYRIFATIASYVAPCTWSFWKSLRREEIDLIFVQDYASGRFDILYLVARILRIPVIAYHAGSRPGRYLGQQVRKYTLPRADALIVSSQEEKHYLRDHWKVPDDRMPVILTPVDTASYAPMDREKACLELEMDSNRRYLLFVGRLDDGVKRISSIIKTFINLEHGHSDVDLLIVGAGPDGEYLKQIAGEYSGTRVKFLGWMSGVDALRPIYNIAECLLLPSLREGFPTVIGEAMACGTPVLASKVGGIQEMVVHTETGWLINPGDDRALNEELSNVLSYPDITRTMRMQVRKMAENNVSVAAVTNQLRNCFLQTLKHYE
jgi:glycosyltransferase involved in cell wall biosynthesis